MGAQIFDRLAARQKQDFADLHPGRDPRVEFDEFVCFLTDPSDDHLRAFEDILRQAVMQTAAIEARGYQGTEPHNESDWSQELNSRRIALIDKEIQGSITKEERAELAELQRRAVAYRDLVAPLPIEGAQRLHRDLLEIKSRRGSGS